MLNRLFAMLGYVPAASAASAALASETPEPNPGPPVLPTPHLPAHRQAAEAFRFAGAARDDLCFWYREDEDIYCHAVGKDDWARLAVVGFSLVANRAREEALDSGITSSLWLGARDDALKSWRQANSGTLGSIGDQFGSGVEPAGVLGHTSDLMRDVIA